MVPDVEAAYGIPKYSITSDLLEAVWPKMSPLVVVIPTPVTAGRHEMRNAPTTVRKSFIIKTTQRKSDKWGCANVIFLLCGKILELSWHPETPILFSGMPRRELGSASGGAPSSGSVSKT